MEPIREGPGALADALDRLLDKGVVLDIDLIIGVANIPLIGINLRLVIAALETMLDYGFMSWLGGTNQIANTDQ
jgi:hypothetical protein